METRSKLRIFRPLGGGNVPLLGEVVGVVVDKSLRRVTTVGRHGRGADSASLHVLEVVLGDAACVKKGQRALSRAENALGAHMQKRPEVARLVRGAASSARLRRRMAMRL